MTVEFKTLAIEAKDAGDGEFEAVLSTPVVDRDVEIVEPGAFDPLPERLKIHVDHDMSTRSLAGSGTPFYDGDTLKVKGRFAATPLGQEVRQLVLDGHLDGMSVGFIRPVREQKDGVTHLTRAELIEASFVTVPANTQALVTAVKVGARNAAKDAERIQSAHDLLTELGATCGADKTVSVEPADPEPAAAADKAAAAAPADADQTTAMARAKALAVRAYVSTRKD